MTTWYATLTYWWNLPQYVRNELHDTLDEFRATLDVSDITKDRVVPRWRWNALGAAMLALWSAPFLLLLALAWVIAAVNGVCKSVLPFLLHHARRGIVRLALAGCPLKPKPAPTPKPSFVMPKAWMTDDTPIEPRDDE